MIKSSRKIIQLFSLLLLFSAYDLFAQDSGISFFEGNFEEAMQEAKVQDKLIFVDAFTTWCGPCKMMKRNVFPDNQVGEYFNEYFINLAIDMETQAGKKFNMQYPVSGYPTLLFINPDGKLIKKSVGAKGVERFLSLGKAALKEDDRSEIYAEMYESGRRDYDFMVKYVKALNKVNKPTSRIAYEYLDGDYELSNEQKALFIFDAVSSSDSKMFEMMTGRKLKKHVLANYGEKVYEEKIYDLCWATVKKGIEFEVEDLVEEGMDKYKNEFKDKHETFDLEAELAVARSKADASSYLKAAKKRVGLFSNPNEVNKFLIEMITIFPSDQKILHFAEKESAAILEENDTIEANFAFAKILIANQQLNNSIDYLNRALELANEEKEYVRAKDIHLLRQQIRSRLKR